MRGASWISMTASFTHMKSKITHKAKKIIFAIESNVSSLAYILRSKKDVARVILDKSQFAIPVRRGILGS